MPPSAPHLNKTNKEIAMIYRTDDPLADFNRHEEDMEKELEKCPECAYCGFKIQDTFAFYIDREWYHRECIESAYLMEVTNE